MSAVYIGNKKVLANTQWGGMFHISSEDLSVGPAVILSGIFEAELTHFMIKNIKPGDTVFDLGANFGYFTILMGKLIGPSGKLVAYEANPSVFSLLKDNVIMNYIKDYSTIYNKAVYSKEDVISFYSTERFQGNSSIHKHDDSYLEFYDNDSSIEIKVEAEPLDVHFGHFDKIDLVKIDIEGGEYHAFKGMDKLIRNGIIRQVVFELNKGMLQSDWDHFCNILRTYRTLGARFFLIKEQGELGEYDLEVMLSHGDIPYILMKMF